MTHDKKCDTQQNTKQSIPALWKLILICSTASFCALLPADAIAYIAKYFSVTPGHSEAVLSWFLLGYGIGPLLYAPLANRWGRKKSLCGGFTVALIAMLVSVVAIQYRLFDVLLFSRFVAGIGTSAGIVVGMMMIVDSTSANKARVMFSYIVLFFAFAPSIAIACGGMLAEYVGFKSIFIAMLGMMLIWLMIVSSLRETYQGQVISLQWQRTLHQYAATLKELPFMYFVLMMTMATAAMYIYNGIAPIIAMYSLHISSSVFGYYALIPSCGLFMGAIISSKCSYIVSAHNLMKLGLASITIASLVMGVLFMFFGIGQMTLISLLVPSFFIFLGAAIVIPNVSMFAISKAKDTALASSMMNASALIFSSLSVSLTSHFIGLNALVLPGALFITAVLALFGLLGSRRISIVNKG